MSAAFMGSIVENNIHKSSLISLICFCSGMIGTGFFICLGGYYKQNEIISSIPLLGIYLSYGIVMGIGLGVGYITPIKTLMLWFRDRKGLATGIAVMGFGLAKAIASPVMLLLMRKLSNHTEDNDISDNSGLWKMFIILGFVYFLLMLLAYLLLKKPNENEDGDILQHEPQINTSWEILATLKKHPLKYYAGIWFVFYLNITCGLALISQEKMIVNTVGCIEFIGIIAIISSIFNAGGRLFLSMLGDKLKSRKTVYELIFLFSTGALLLVIFAVYFGKTESIFFALLVINAIFIINAGYGGGFSNIATLLSDYYGMNCLSKIHGITLSAWAFAGLTGNQLATFILTHLKNNINFEYNYLFIILMLLYLLSFFITIKTYKNSRIIK